MTKRITRRHAPSGQVDEVGHLDETLTEVTSTATATFKKYRYHIVTAAAILTVLIGAVVFVDVLHEGNLVSRNEDLWTLLLSPAAQKDGPGLQALENLLEDARGSDAERYVVKTVGEYLALRAVEEPTDATTGSGVAKEEAYRKALELASDVRARFPDDADLQKWADGVEKKLEGEQDTSWMPAGPSYRLPVPPSGNRDG